MFSKPIQPGHKEAYDYLTGWLYQWREPLMHRIALLYRNADLKKKVTARIEIVDMVEYFSDKPWQVQAMDALKEQYGNLPDDVKAHFENLFYKRDNPAIAKNTYERNGIVWVGAPRPEYETQRNNPAFSKMNWTNTCNVSATSMMHRSLELRGVKFRVPVPTDEQLVREIYDAGYDVSTDHAIVDKVFYDVLGSKCRFLYNADYAEIDKQLVEQGDPVVLGILHKGSWKAAWGGGHMIMLYGKVLTIDGEPPAGVTYIGHDPWGRLPDYTDHNGADELFDRDMTLEGRWQLFSKNNGYLRVFDGVE